MHAVAALALAAAALLQPGIGHATTAADLCDPTADPCELTTDVTVTPGSSLDFGARAFEIKAPGGRLQVTSGDTLSITAGSMVVESGVGGRLRNAANSDGGCTINIGTSGNFELRRVPGSTLAVNFSSNQALCEMHVVVGGDATIGAELDARGTGSFGVDGGGVYLSVAGRTTVSDAIVADGTGVGGSVEIAGQGPVEIQGGSIDVSGGFGFGTLVLSTDADLTVGGKLDVKGTSFQGDCADGGFLVLSAKGNVTIASPVSATGSSITGFGCAGGLLSIDAGGSIFVNATIDASGGAPDGEGGLIQDFRAAADFVQTAPILAGGNGLFGTGGDVTIVAGRVARVGALLDVAGGAQGGGGLLRMQGGEKVEIADEVRADGAGFGSLAFATVADSAPQVGGLIAVTGYVHARSSDPDFVGTVSMEACAIDVGATGRVKTEGAASRILLRASDTMTIAGTLDAGPGVTALQHRDPAKPPRIATGAMLTPAPTITTTPTPPDAELRPCGCTLTADVPGLLCDDGNPCTQELCDAAAGCTSVPLTGEGIAGCDDGNVCDGRETCVANSCTPGTPPPADDGEPCTDDGACDPVAGYARTARTGFGAATCRMDRIDLALAGASSPGDVSVKAKTKIAALARRVRSLVEQAGGADGKRRARLLRAAAKKAKRLDRVIASPKSGLAANLAQILTLATTEVRATLSSLATTP